MRVLPGLTSTRPELITPFLADLRRSSVRTIAFFPTCLDPASRRALYAELEAIAGLAIPHVHLRSDCFPGEIAYLGRRFGSVAFNIHPAASGHPFDPAQAPEKRRLFVENVEVPPDDAELAELGGLCPDWSHLENARLFGRTDYVATMERQLGRFPVGCCHISAIRAGEPNRWSGGWDQHDFRSLGDFDYLAAYRAYLPADWASLELENSLGEQLEAVAYLEGALT
jgi:hypothetical protein